METFRNTVTAVSLALGLLALSSAIVLGLRALNLRVRRGLLVASGGGLLFSAVVIAGGLTAIPLTFSILFAVGCTIWLLLSVEGTRRLELALFGILGMSFAGVCGALALGLHHDISLAAAAEVPTTAAFDATSKGSWLLTVLAILQACCGAFAAVSAWRLFCVRLERRSLWNDWNFGPEARRRAMLLSLIALLAIVAVSSMVLLTASFGIVIAAMLGAVFAGTLLAPLSAADVTRTAPLSACVAAGSISLLGLACGDVLTVSLSALLMGVSGQEASRAWKSLWPATSPDATGQADIASTREQTEQTSEAEPAKAVHGSGSPTPDALPDDETSETGKPGGDHADDEASDESGPAAEVVVLASSAPPRSVARAKTPRATEISDDEIAQLMVDDTSAGLISEPDQAGVGVSLALTSSVSRSVEAPHSPTREVDSHALRALTAIPAPTPLGNIWDTSEERDAIEDVPVKAPSRPPTESASPALPTDSISEPAISAVVNDELRSWTADDDTFVSDFWDENGPPSHAAEHDTSALISETTLEADTALDSMFARDVLTPRAPLARLVPHPAHPIPAPVAPAHAVPADPLAVQSVAPTRFDSSITQPSDASSLVFEMSSTDEDGKRESTVPELDSAADEEPSSMDVPPTDASLVDVTPSDVPVSSVPAHLSPAIDRSAIDAEPESAELADEASDESVVQPIAELQLPAANPPSSQTIARRSPSRPPRPEAPCHRIGMSQLAHAVVTSRRIMLIPGEGCLKSNALAPLYELGELLVFLGHEVSWLVHSRAGHVPGRLRRDLQRLGVPAPAIVDERDAGPLIAQADCALVAGAADITCSTAIRTLSPGAIPFRLQNVPLVLFLKRTGAAGQSQKISQALSAPNACLVPGNVQATLDCLLDMLSFRPETGTPAKHFGR